MPAITIPRTFSIDDAPSSPSDSDSRKIPQLKTPTAPKSSPTHRDLFSVAGLPKLDTFVSLDNLPDVIAVYDKGNITNRCPGGHGDQAVYYKRAYPKSERTDRKNPRRACLFLDKANCIESGRRSTVYRAPLFATLGPKGEARKSVVVAAKVANDSCRSHSLLRDEARGYATFPEQFFNDSDPHPWAMGSATPLVHHKPAMRSRSFPGWGVVMSPRSSAPRETVPPITPKFYGYYVPIDPKTSRSLAPRHRDCEDFQNAECDVSDWPKSILLMEDCGQRIDPGTMSSEHREQCLQLVERMHCLGFSHGHARASNMLVQPGPLSLPREQRSMDTPSFRLISLGRWRGACHPQVLESPQGAMRAFCKGRQNDVHVAMQELGMINASGSDVD